MARELFQSGSTYLPAAWLADTTQPRTFTGSADPSTVSGVALAVNDLWEQVASTQSGGYGLSPYGQAPYGS